MDNFLADKSITTSKSRSFVEGGRAKSLFEQGADATGLVLCKPPNRVTLFMFLKLSKYLKNNTEYFLLNKMLLTRMAFVTGILRHENRVG